MSPLPGFIVGLVAAALTLAVACDAADGEPPSDRPPSIANVALTPSQVTAGVPARLEGSVDIADEDGDFATLELQMTDPSGGVGDLSLPIPNPGGLTSAVAPFALDFTAAEPGGHTLSLQLVDAAGHRSNVLTRTVMAVAATDPGPTSVAPRLEGLTFAPRSVTVGASVELAGSVAVSDADGDATALHVRATGPNGFEGAEVVVALDLAGGTSAVASFSYPFTAPASGTYTLRLHAVDATGLSSSPVSNTLSASVGLPKNPTVDGLALDQAAITPGTAVTVTGVVTVADEDGDATTLVVRAVPPVGSAQPDTSSPVDLDGATAGEVPFAVVLASPIAGTYTIEVWALDAGGRRSNTLSASLASVPTAPVITALTAQPLLVFVDVEATLTGTVTASDPNGDLAGVTLRVRTPDGGFAVDGHDVALADTGDAHAFAFPFTADEVGTYVLEAVAVDDEGTLSALVTQAIVADDLTGVADACAATATDCTGQGFCYNVTDSTCEYIESRGLTFAACDEVTPGAAVPTCVSSISDLSSPWASSDSNCGFVQYWSNPTDFPIDCRCPDAAFEPRCQRPYNLPAATSFGDGSRIRDLATTVHLRNGVVVGREWFVPAGWSAFNQLDQTMIFAVHLDTGARRHVSGRFVHPADGTTDVGAGPPFVNVLDLALGADGQIYAMGARSDIAPPKVWRVDPTTGDRTLLFDEETAAEATLCPNGSTLPGRKTVQMVGEGWAMDAAGDHYFSIIGAPGPSIVKLSSDFSSCTYLTRVTTATLTTLTDNVGPGYDIVQFNFRGLSIHDGKLFAVSDTKLIEVDLADGRRRLRSNAKEVGGLGAGPINAEGLGHRWSAWDAHRGVLWTVGLSGGSLAVAVDLDSGDRTPWPCWHPTLGKQAACNNVGIALVPGPLNFGGFAIDPLPPHDLVFAHDAFSIVRYEVKTGNAYIFSL